MSNGQYTAADQTVDAKVMARAVNKLEKAFFHQTVKSKHGYADYRRSIAVDLPSRTKSVDDPSHAIDGTPLFISKLT